MAPSSNTLILSLKTILISTVIISIAIFIKFSVPLILNFALHELPMLWFTLISWLKPPYLYFIVNGIIITIAASSRFHQYLDDDNQSEPLVQATAPTSYLPSDFGSSQSEFVSEPRVLEVKRTEVVGDEDGDELVISKSTWTPPQRINTSENQTECVFPVTEKPLVSARFSHRKPVKSSPEGGRALRVVKPKRQETLESTWKTMTDGRHMPLTRHLRKSDTWGNHGRQFNSDQSPQKLIKSETFKDHTNYDPQVRSSPGSGKIRKEASPSQDELNRRVEAFIKKFNEEMRLQRQESLNQYKEMVNCRAH